MPKPGSRVRRCTFVVLLLHLYYGRIYMHHARKFMILALLAGLVATAFTGVANAGRSLQIEPPRNIRASGRVTFADPTTGIEVISNLTLGIEHNERIAKTRGAVLATILDCRTEGERSNIGAAAVRCELAIGHTLNYESFGGTLPRITSVVVTARTPGFLLRILELECLYRGEPRATISESRGGQNADQGVFRSEILIPLFRVLRGEEFFRRCPRNGRLAGGLTFERPRRVTLLA